MSRARRSKTTVAALAALVLTGGASACSPRPIEPRVPTLAAEVARGEGALALEPILPATSPSAIRATPPLAGADPAAALTAGIRTELAARAFRGGATGGYTARCRLGRFALRRTEDKTHALALLYVDLECATQRRADGALVWRGALRGRAASSAMKAHFDDDDRMNQRLLDRLMSDVTRELASDLGVRVLGLRGSTTRRRFADAEAERASSGYDDSELGDRALAATPDAARAVRAELQAPDKQRRAAAWNAIAMAAAPDGPWLAGVDTVFDRDAVVRFYQYKALARHASPATLRELKLASSRDKSATLKEFLGDLGATGGLPLRPSGEAAPRTP